MNGYIAGIRTTFIDVPGRIAVAIYFSGCSIRCNGCHNTTLWEKSNGELMSCEDIITRVKKHPFADSVVFLGGEPTDQQDYLISLCNQLNHYKVLYTGREFEELPKELTALVDMIICGPFKLDQKTDGYPASKNQRIFNKTEGSWTCQHFR